MVTCLYPGVEPSREVNNPHVLSEGTLRREKSDSHYPSRVQDFDQAAQMNVTRGEQRLALSPRQFVRCAVATAVLEEDQRAVIRDEVLPKKTLRGAKVVCDGTPQARAADFPTWAIEPQDRPLGVFDGRPTHLGMNAEPVANILDGSERDSGLGHSEWPRIHPDEDHLLRVGPETL